MGRSGPVSAMQRDFFWRKDAVVEAHIVHFALEPVRAGASADAERLRCGWCPVRALDFGVMARPAVR